MMEKIRMVVPKLVNGAQEANWWASHEDRAFLKQKAAGTGKKEGGAPAGSRLVGRSKRAASVHIALRFPEPGVAKARELAARKSIGYQTLLKMLVYEGLRRESRPLLKDSAGRARHRRITICGQLLVSAEAGTTTISRGSSDATLEGASFRLARYSPATSSIRSAPPWSLQTAFGGSNLNGMPPIPREVNPQGP